MDEGTWPGCRRNGVIHVVQSRILQQRRVIRAIQKKELNWIAVQQRVTVLVVKVDGARFGEILAGT